MWRKTFGLLIVLAFGGSGMCRSAEPVAAASETDSHWYDFMPGDTSHDKLYLGMWSYHFNDKEEYKSQHHLLGLVYAGYFAGSFINSKNERAWGAGLQRDLYRSTTAGISVDAGYRAGLLYGYDGSYEIRDSKLFPLLMLYSDVSYQRIGLQFAWGGEVVTAGFMLNLD
jgi:hypothetical protein